jgi:hypothetical protein
VLMITAGQVAAAIAYTNITTCLATLLYDKERDGACGSDSDDVIGYCNIL